MIHLVVPKKLLQVISKLLILSLNYTVLIVFQSNRNNSSSFKFKSFSQRQRLCSSRLDWTQCQESLGDMTVTRPDVTLSLPAKSFL